MRRLTAAKVKTLTKPACTTVAAARRRQCDIGFSELGGFHGQVAEEPMRMLSATGNPRARNVLEIIDCLQQREGVNLKVQASGDYGDVESRLDRGLRADAEMDAPVISSW